MYRQNVILFNNIYYAAVCCGCCRRYSFTHSGFHFVYLPKQIWYRQKSIISYIRSLLNIPLADLQLPFRYVYEPSMNDRSHTHIFSSHRDYWSECLVNAHTSRLWKRKNCVFDSKFKKWSLSMIINCIQDYLCSLEIEIITKFNYFNSNWYLQITKACLDVHEKLIIHCWVVSSFRELPNWN